MHGKRCFNRPHHFSPLREDGGGLSKQEISEKPMYCGGWPGYGKKIHGGGAVYSLPGSWKLLCGA